MTFQEIDFHIELFKAYLEPKEARFAYLDLLKKKSGYPKEAFFAKLDQAYNNLRQAWEDFHSLRTSKLIGDKNIGLPISGFNRYPVLLNFSMTFPSHIYKSTIQDLGEFVLSYKNQNRLKKLRKLIDSKIGNDLFISEKNSDTTKEPINKTERFLIIDPEIRTKLFTGLKQYFEGQESDLENLLKSKQISEKLVWTLNQNQLADLFLRLTDNGFIKNNKTQIKSWIAKNFTLSSGPINENSVYDILIKKSKVPKSKRILEDLASFKPNSN